MRPLPSLLSLLLLYLPLLNFQKPMAALPLSTSSRWLVDEDGRRIKLACVNWASHLETMLAEGLGKQPLDTISKHIVSMGFNCVRLTWPLFLVTNHSLSSLTVRQSFQEHGLLESIAAIEVNNPVLVDLPLIQALKAVVSNLGDNDIMVILDNHISKPGWCCSVVDGNGFFGDKYFDPDVWLRGLKKMATIFNGSANVVGMSLRNELRGPRQNVRLWYRYMQKGAEAVHSANPNVLVILSGLTFDSDLRYLSKRQVKLTFTGKLVFELHWYGFVFASEWENENPNIMCAKTARNITTRAGFLLDKGWPLFLGEFGVDQTTMGTSDERFFSCLMGVLAELDLDWCLWALQGSYYINGEKLGGEESFGALSWDWSKARNSSLLQRLQPLQSPFRGPGISDIPPYTTIFHPSSSLCVLRKSLTLELGPCTESEAWTYTARQTLALKGTPMCLKADGAGKPARLGTICSDHRSKWKTTSKFLLSAEAPGNSNSLCLDIGSDGRSIITNQCKCLSGDGLCNPQSQWFKMVTSTRPLQIKVDYSLAT